MGAVGIIAGRGALPLEISRRLTRTGRAVVLAEMDGFPADNPEGLPCIRFRPERMGALFRALRGSGVEDVVFAGAVRRPRLEPTKFDLKTLSLAPRLVKAIAAGDDGTLRAVLAVFEAEGFRVRAAHDLLPDLLPPAGQMALAQPDDRARKDAARAARIVAALGAVDVGQGAVVAQGVALAVESAPGTDAMLDWVAGPAGRLRPDPDGPGGVLYKAAKPGQDRRVDLPVIGPATLAAAARAGLAGVAIEAGGVMVLDRPATVAAADAAGLFLWVRRPEPAA